MNKESKLIHLSDELNIDKKLEEIWFNRYDKQEVISPLFPRELYSNCIAFLSFNPSLLPKDRKGAKRGNYPAESYPVVDWKKEKADYPFFNKFYELGKEFGSWTVMDLLYERDSTQKNIELKYNPIIINDKDKIFVQSQIKLSFQILEKIKPSLVIASNRGVINLIHQNLNELEIKQELPNNENNFIYRLNNIPFITEESAFLGSRILSYNSKRRKKLNEEIKRILNITKK